MLIEICKQIDKQKIKSLSGIPYSFSSCIKIFKKKMSIHVYEI